MLNRILCIGILSSITVGAMASNVSSINGKTCYTAIIVDSAWYDSNITFNAISSSDAGQVVKTLGYYRGGRATLPVIEASYSCQSGSFVIQAKPVAIEDTVTPEYPLTYFSQSVFDMSKDVTVIFPRDFYRKRNLS